MIIEFEEPVRYSPDMSNVPERYLRESFDAMDFAGREPAMAFLAEYVRAFSYGGKDSLVLCPGEFAARMFVSLYRAVASRVTADAVRFWDWPAQSAWLRSLGWRAEHELLEGLWGARFVFLFDVRAGDPELVRAVIADCLSAGRRLLIFTRDEALHRGFPNEVTALLDEKAYPVHVTD